MIAKDNNRMLTVNLKQAYLLKLLEENGIFAPRLNDENIRIYIPRKTWGLILRDDYPENIKLQDYLKWEREFLNHENAVTYEDIKNNQSDYIFQCNFFEIKEADHFSIIAPLTELLADKINRDQDPDGKIKISDDELFFNISRKEEGHILNLKSSFVTFNI